MRTIGRSRLLQIPQNGGVPVELTCNQIRKSEAIQVQSYLELANKIAEIQYLNPEYVLVFRGQAHDYRDEDNLSSIRPGIFRGRDRVVGRSPIEARFSRLHRAERLLIDHWQQAPIAGNERIKKYRILRWSILQHYEICETPLLDVTYSLRVAASFASLQDGGDGYVFALGVPNISGTITTDMEAGLQVVRLSSVCPPQARRPHIQEGYLLGEYPDISVYTEKQNYSLFEVDFGRRLLAKFKFDKKSFWSRNTFPKISTQALYPDKHDPFMDVSKQIKAMLGD
ncbi:FRG domain-containing protein [Phaeobacter sp. B1627]|uniref:FRG domain-containing protein n=1 Tax=Phaeobacter sp. B1627 TaxID=2583809 RepID=UPI001118E979|nr:FRG domain-containing protein [Phaeobacter sp. B1627]TNJ39599.1 FRG domain-containing protein [Phaeobacter sp. B1627]